MSEKDVILLSLRKVDRRIRGNRLLAELSRTLLFFLIFLAAFKTWDLFRPLGSTTVVTVITIWLLALVTASSRIVRRKSSLSQSAATIDRNLNLYDEIASAYWFINNAVRSPWVDRQIDRAARTVRGLDINRTYPRILPRSSYLAGGTFLLLAGLNFSPLSQDHNWFALEAGPVYRLTADEQELLEQASDLLIKIGDERSANALRAAVSQLEAGNLSASEVLQRLDAALTMLEQGELNIDGIYAGLEEIGRDLMPSNPLRDAANLLLAKNPAEAAQQIRLVSGGMETISTQDLPEMQASLERASDHERAELSEVYTHLKESASGIQNENKVSASEGLIHTAQDLEQLALRIEIQQLKDEAILAIASLADAIRQRLDEESSGQQDGQSVGWNAPLPEDRRGPDGSPAGNEAQGLEPSGEAVANPQREGRSTTLKVQLQLERVAGQRAEGKSDEPREATTRERSGLVYVPAVPDSAASRKDAMNQEDIPWEYRPLIKSYFESIGEDRASGR